MFHEIKIKSHYNEGMADCPFFNERRYFLNGHMNYFDIFIGIKIYFCNLFRVPDKIGMTKIIKNSRVGINRAKELDIVPGITRSLRAVHEALPPGGLLRRQGLRGFQM